MKISRGEVSSMDFSDVSTGKKLKPVHPGDVLLKEFIEPMGLSVYALAKAIHVTRSRINEICHGRQGITANIALRLGRFFDAPRFVARPQA